MPYCLVFKDGEVQQNAIGYRIESLNDLFAEFISEFKITSQNKKKNRNCENNHQLS